MSLDLPLLAQWVANADECAARGGMVGKVEVRREVDPYAEKRMAEGSKMDLIAAYGRQGLSARETANELKK
jgi:hypothetical protein